MTEERFGRLRTIRKIGMHTPPNGSRVAVWLCVCDCGQSVEVRRPNLTSGDTASCGCLRRETAGALVRTHGLSHRTRTYDTWVLMRQRCNNPKANGYRYYGGRGIQVCARWNSYTAFLEDMGERPDGLTIDRIDPEGHYEPINCRWATWHEQAINKRKPAECAA